MTMHSRPLPGVIELKGDNDGDDTSAVEKALANLSQTVDSRLGEVEKKAADLGKLGTRLDEIEKKLARPAIGGKASEDEEKKTETKAFESFCRHGVERMGADEAKALTVSTDTAGGFLAPEEFGGEILKKLVQFSPIRQYARVVSVSAKSVKYPRRVSGPSATWTEENTDRTGSEPVYEQIALTPYELATYIEVSNALLEDAAFDIGSELSADLAEAFGVTEGTAFVTGDGNGKPKGLLAASGITEVKTGAAATLGTAPADTIIAMYHALPSVFAQSGVWLMNRTVLGSLRTLKDSTGRYLLADPVSAGAATTLLGRPIAEAVDLPNVAANAYPILFGDLSGYRIVDRVALSLLRDPYSAATKGNVRFHARKRVAADVTSPDRFVKLKVAL